MKPAVLKYQKSNHSGDKHLIDPFGRQLDYLRLSITERCNLRCSYCMPSQGVPLKPREYILSFEEMHRLVKIFLELGIKKIRITGGEPFVRKGAFDFIKSINDYRQLKSINLTTNGVFIADYLPEMKNLKLDSLNISLDSLDRETFKKITLRDEFDVVYENIFKSVDLGIRTKINVVLLAGVNEQELPAFAKLTKDNPLEVRFIEAMPFNGDTFDENIIYANQMIDILKKEFELIEQPRIKNSTSRMFCIPGYKGKIGFIEGFSRTFCGSCNRLRITADGMFKTCLYDRVAVNFKELLRENKLDQEIINAILDAVSHRAKDGFESQKRAKPVYNLSMAQIGG